MTASRRSKVRAVGGGRLGIGDVQRLAADAFGGKLAVEGRAVAGGLLVVGLRVAWAAGFGGAAEPVIGA